MKHKELTYKIIGVFYDVYNDLGRGFLESAYQRSMGFALEAEGLKVSNYIKIPVWFRGLRVGQFEGDMLVADAVLLELKATRVLGQISPVPAT